MATSCLLLLIQILYSQCDSYTKQVTLTPQNPSEQGAQVNILQTNQVTTTATSWNLIALDKIGFHLQLSLEPIIWGFYPSIDSNILISIDSSTQTPIDASLILSATVSNKYVTVSLKLQGDQQNKISPSCNPDSGAGDNYLSGDVLALVNADTTNNRQWKATNDNQKVNFPESNIGKGMDFPITMDLSNGPSWDEMFLTIMANGWDTLSFEQFCLFQKINANLGLDVYIALNTVGEALNITSITVTYTHSGTGAPSLSPTAKPTVNPTKFPTLNPSKFPSKFPSVNPTQIPTETPTKSPTMNPTKFPTKFPTMNPTKFPTKFPTDIPTNMPSTAQPTQTPNTHTPTYMPTTQPTMQPTNIPSTDPTLDPTVNPTFIPTTMPTIPTGDPTFIPTFVPTYMPTMDPTKFPTFSPTLAPSNSPTRPQGEVGGDSDRDTTEFGDESESNDSLRSGNEIFGKTFMKYVVMSVIGIIFICVLFICVMLKKIRKQKRALYRDNTVEMERISSLSKPMGTDTITMGNGEVMEKVNRDVTIMNGSMHKTAENVLAAPVGIGLVTNDGSLMETQNISDIAEDENDAEMDAMYASNRNLNKHVTDGGDESESTDDGINDDNLYTKPGNVTAGN